MNYFKDTTSKIMLAVFGFVCIFLFVSLIRQCSEMSQKIGQDIAVTTVQGIKENKEIELLNSKVQDLEQHIATLEYKIYQIDSLRDENNRTTINKSKRESYRDITKRYTK